MPEDTVLYEHPSAIAIGAATGAADVSGVAARTYDIGYAIAQRAMSAGMTRKPQRPNANENMVPLPFRERRTDRTRSELVSPGTVRRRSIEFDRCAEPSENELFDGERDVVDECCVLLT